MTIHDAKALIGLCIDEGLKQGVLKNKGEFEELLDYLDKYFANTDKMPSGSSEVQKDLEEAAEEWAKENYGVNYMDFDFTQDAAFRAMYHFRGGAKWDRQQMLKDAVEGEITKDNRGNNVLRAGLLNNGFEINDKVRVIVLPKEN